jgi:hypothetical protein
LGSPEVRFTLAEIRYPICLQSFSEWSPDTEDEGVVRDVRAFTDRPKIREEIAAEGKLAYISVTTGFWCTCALCSLVGRLLT